MNISDNGIRSIQATYQARQAMGEELKAITALMNSAVLTNPYDLVNDASFQHIKGVARIAQALNEMDAALRALYESAAQINTRPIARPLLLLTRAAVRGTQNENATDVLPKKRKRAQAGVI